MSASDWDHDAAGSLDGKRVRPALIGVAAVGCVAAALAFGMMQLVNQPVEADDDVGTMQASLADPDVTGSIPSSVVYIQASDMDSRFQAESLWAALNEAGIRTPGIELTGRAGPSTAEVRYFHDADRKLADRVAAIAAQNGLSNVRVRSDSNSSARRGQIELRYPG